MPSELQKITLKKPLLINGKEVTELTYNTDEITCELYARAFDDRGTGTAVTVVQEFDSVLFMNLGFMAVIAVNPNIDIMDLKRVKGADLMQFIGIGRNFIFGRGEIAEIAAD